MILSFIDTETTGLDLVDHEVIDLAILSVNGNKEKNIFNNILQFNTKVKPQNIALASQEALKLNHFSESEWDNAPSSQTILPILKQILDKTDYVVGQNVVFDYRFINKMFDNEQIPRPKWNLYFDTKHMAEQLVHDKKIKKSSLDYLCKHFDIKNIGRPHTALCDVLRTFELFKILSAQTESVLLDFSHPYDPYKDKK
jgi:DNA polymerase III epsilon subunit-like protein